MNKFRKLMRSPFTTGVLFVLAAWNLTGEAVLVFRGEIEV